MAQSNEERFFAAFTDRINIELDKHYHPSQEEKRDLIAIAENMVGLAQAGLFFAGVASVPFTFGLGLAAAAGAVVVLKAGQLCLDAYVEHKQNIKALPREYLDSQRDLQRLALYLLLRQASFSIAIRYHHSLETTLELDSISKFGQYVAYRLMKKLFVELNKNPRQLPSIDTLVDYFLSSVNHSGLINTEEVVLQPLKDVSPLRIAALSRKISTKQFCARQRWLCFENNSIKILAAETTPFHDQFVSTTTRKDLGYITIPEYKRNGIPLAIDSDKFKEVVVPASEMQKIVQDSLFPHEVTAQEILDYQQAFQKNDTLNLNGYLTQKYSRPTIACCHTDVLKGLVFIGNYDYVNFYEADLSECNFAQANFNHANLTRAKLLNIITGPKTNFQAIQAEGSIWMGESNKKIVIHGNISFAKLRGSTWGHCQIDTLTTQIESEWELAVVDVEMADFANQALAAQLQQEQSARLNDQKRLATVETKVDTLGNALAKIDAKIDENLKIQNERDSKQDQRIDELAAGQDVFINLQQHCITEFYTNDYRAKAETYIPLTVMPIPVPPNTSSVLLTDYLYTALPSLQSTSPPLHPKFIFVTGASGSGKTFAVTRFGEGINALHSIEHPWVFVPLDASTISDRSSNIINTALTKAFANGSRANLPKHPCIIHLSKIDLSNIPIEKLLKDCNDVSTIWKQPLIFIFTTRNRYIEQASVQLDRIIQKNPQDYLRCELQPLDDLQIQNFFELFPKKKLSNLYRVFEEVNIFDANALARTPLMLTIMTGVLADLVVNKSPKPMQRIDVYRASWRALFDRIRDRLPDEYQDYSNFMQEMFDLAKNMLKTRLDSVAFTIPTMPQPSLKKSPFQQLLETKMGALSPLLISTVDNTNYLVKFLHPSLGYSLIAEILLENLFKRDFPNQETYQIWGRHYLLRTPEILEFLIELLKQFPENIAAEQQHIKMVKQDSFTAINNAFSTDEDDEPEEEPPISRDRKSIQERLLQLVKSTHITNPKRKNNTQLASNALTVLCKWGRDLSGQNFSELLLHHVDGTNGLLAYVNFENSDLSGSCFYNAFLFRTRLLNTILNQTRFLNATRFLEVGGAPKTFLVYRSLTDVILAYPIAPDSNNKKFQIAIAKITGEQIELLRYWPAHDQDISAMDVSSYQNNVRLASAGVGGTIRVWTFPLNAQPNEIAKLRGIKHREPIDHLVWGPDGNVLATGSRDGHVRIWDVSAQKKIYKSAPLSSAVRALVWGKQRRLLIAATDNSNLSLWQGQIANLDAIEIAIPQTSPISAVHSLAFSTDESQLAIGTAHGEILIMNLTTQEIDLELNGHKGPVTSIQWYGDLISSSQDQTIRIWPTIENKSSIIFQHDHPIGKTDILPNGQIIAGIDTDCSRLYFWDRTQPSYQSTLAQPLGLIFCMAANPVRNIVAVGDVKGTVIVYPIKDIEQPDEPLHKPLYYHEQASVQHLFWSKNGQYLASIGQDQCIYIKDTQTSTPPGIIRPLPNKWLTHLAWSTSTTDSQELIIGFSNGLIEIYNSRTSFKNAVVLQPNQPADAITWLATRTVAPQLAIASGQNISVCNLDKSACIIQAHPQHAPKILIWSSDGTCLASCDEAATLYIWTVSAEHLTLIAQYQALEIKCMLWTSNWFILGNSKEILYWSTTSGAEIRNTAPQRIPLRARLLTSSADNQILFASNIGISFFSPTELANAQQSEKNWQPHRLKAGFCAAESETTGSTGASHSTQSYLEKNGTINNKTKGFSIFTFSSESASQISTNIPEPAPHQDFARLFPSKIPQQPLVQKIASRIGREDLDEDTQMTIQ